MSDLAAKFTALEAQLTTQQSAVMSALSAILEALGGLAPAGGTTLADVVSAIGTTNGQLTAMGVQLASIISQLQGVNTRLIGIRADQQSANTAINTNLDTIITNNSLNAQRMIAAILQTACACATDAPLVGPPLDVTPTALVDQDKCRRIQYYLSIFGAVIDQISNYGGAGAAITSGTLAEIIIAAAASGALVGGEIGAVAGPPGIVVTAIVGIIAAIVAALGSAYLFTLSSEWHQAPLGDQLLAALYAADSADTGAEAFYNTIGASEVLDTIFKPLINALWWNGWSNDIYSGVPEVDDSAFDGSICLPGFPPADCVTLVAVSGVTRSDGLTLYHIVWPQDGSSVLPSSVRPSGFDTITASADIWYNGSLSGVYMRCVGSTIRIYTNPAGDNRTFDLNDTYQVIPFGTSYVEASTDHAFSIEVCGSAPL